jgi:TPR repeat protein
MFTALIWLTSNPDASALRDAGRSESPTSNVRCVSGPQCRAIGEQFCSYKNEHRDERTGAQYFQLGCDMNDVGSCVSLATMLFGGTSPNDELKAFQLYQRACTLNDLYSCGVVAQIFERGSRQPGIVPRDLPRAAQIYQQACEGGDACSCINLADLYSHGRGVKKDKRRAKELTERGRRNGCDTRE